MRLRRPPALMVFPTLNNFKALHPRQLDGVRIGNERPFGDELVVSNILGSDEDPITRKDIVDSFEHVYHDLGVLVFSGLTDGQTARVGDIIDQILKHGGPGRITSRLFWTTMSTHSYRHPAPSQEDLYIPYPNERVAGRLKPEALLRMTIDQCHQVIQRRAELLGITETLYIREELVRAVSHKRPRGSALNTVSGERQLPIQSFTSIGVQRTSGRYTCITRFFNVPTGTIVGMAKVVLLARNWDPELQEVRPFYRGTVQNDACDVHTYKWNQAVKQTLTSTLSALWQLEREVWSSKADELIEKDELPLRKKKPSSARRLRQSGEEDDDDKQRRRPQEQDDDDGDDDDDDRYLHDFLDLHRDRD